MSLEDTGYSAGTAGFLSTQRQPSGPQVVQTDHALHQVIYDAAFIDQQLRDNPVYPEPFRFSLNDSLIKVLLILGGVLMVFLLLNHVRSA